MNRENPPVAAEGFDKSEKREHLFSRSNSTPPQEFSVELMGTVAHIAQFIYDASPRPVPQIAMAGALTLWAGIVGRSWNVSGTGLNIYLALVASTGSGKEAIAAGISKLISALKVKVPTVTEVEGPTHIASPQALIKWLARAPCVYSIVGEFGKRLSEMNSRRASANDTGIKRIMLDVYGKSGQGQSLGAMAYSKREDNTAVINSPSFTFIGECTPETFYPNMNESWVSDGFLPRFMVIDYEGPRVDENENHFEVRPAEELLTTIANVVAQAQSLAPRGIVQNVGMTPEAKAEFKTFGRDCDRYINSQDKTVVERELWNRAHLKAMKLAALYAVGCNYLDPCINEQQAQYAIEEIFSQTVALIHRFERGEVGIADENTVARRNAVIKAIAQYLSRPFDGKYGAREDLHADKIVTQNYLQQKLSDTAPFRNARIGATNALKEVIKNMIEADDLREIPKNDLVKKYECYARSFSISNGKIFADAI